MQTLLPHWHCQASCVVDCRAGLFGGHGNLLVHRSAVFNMGSAAVANDLSVQESVE